MLEASDAETNVPGPKALMRGTTKRLGIYFFFDKEGIVDDYVVTFLKDIVKNLDNLLIVSNGELTESSIIRLIEFTDKIIIRENRGLDVWAYKTAMDSLGWDEVGKYDEILLMNSTIMGPVFPFSEMFEEMDKRAVDFWGINAFHEVPNDPFGLLPDGYIPWHLQSHFIAVRQRMVRSSEFQAYWDNMPEINSYAESVCFHEATFTKRFEQLGFTAGVYIDTEDLEEFTFYPLMINPVELVSARRCPVFKRRSFFNDYEFALQESLGTSALKLFKYLRDKTSYDVDQILQNALRSVDMSDLVQNLHLSYVLPTDVVKRETQYQVDRIALVVHVYYLELFDELLGYISSMPSGCSVIVTTDTDAKAEWINERMKGVPYLWEVRTIPNRGRDVSALLVGAQDVADRFDLVCFIHDKKVTQLRPYSVGAGFGEKCLENLLPTPEFVENVIDLFRSEKRLGLLTPTPPNHAGYFSTHIDTWGPNLEMTKSLLEDLRISVPIEWGKGPVSPLGTMFWFRTHAIRPLFDRRWEYEDFPEEPNGVDGTFLHAIERAYSYVGQSRGFYTAWIYSDTYAAVELTNLRFQVAELAKAALNPVQPGTLHDMKAQLQVSPSLGELQQRDHLIHQLDSDLYRARLHASPRHRIKQIIKRVLPESASARIRRAVNHLKGIQ